METTVKEVKLLSYIDLHFHSFLMSHSSATDDNLLKAYQLLCMVTIFKVNLPI